VLIALVVGIVSGPGATENLKRGGFQDPASESIRAEAILREKLGIGGADIVVTFGSDRLAVFDQDFRTRVEAVLDEAKRDPVVAGIVSPYAGDNQALVSKDGHLTYAVITLRGDDDAKAEAFRELKPMFYPEGIEANVGGQVAYVEAAERVADSDLRRAELITFPAVFVLLLLVFGSATAAAMPLLVAALTITSASLLLGVLAHQVDVSVLSVNPMTLLGLALSVDYSLLIVNRFREELETSVSVRAALARTLATAGRSVALSGIAVAASLLGLLFFPLMFVRSLGIGGILAAVMAVVWSLTGLVVVLAILGRRIDRFSLPWSWSRGGGASLWRNLSHWVMRHPVAILCLVLALLLAIAWPALRLRTSSDDPRMLPASEETYQSYELLRSGGAFDPSETAPIQIAVQSQGPMIDQGNVSALYDYVAVLAATPGVERVDSVFGPDRSFTKEEYRRLFEEHPEAVGQYARGDTTLVTVVGEPDPTSDQARNLVKRVRSITPPPQLRADVGGVTAVQIDQEAGVIRALPFALGFVAFVMFVALFMFFGSVIVPIKAIVVNVLSLAATFGVLVAIFQEGLLHQFLGFDPLGAIDITLPLIVAAFAFGLSMDYEVFLLSRIKEEYDRSGDNRASVASGLERTGRVITGAAAIMVAVVAAFAAGQFLYIRELGVAVVFAVALDATVVRALLVPAAMRLMGHLNWWAPQPLTALRRRLTAAAPAQIE